MRRPFFFPFLFLSGSFASLALGGVVLAAPDSPQPSSTPAPTRVILTPAPPQPVAPDAGAPIVAPWIVSKTPADPTPLVSKSQWVYDLRWDKGSIYLLGVHPLELPAPQATPRVMGRFALELYSGATLVERARFDFPMLGAGEGAPREDAGPRRTREDLDRVSFADKLITRIGVIFPATRKGNRLDLVDRMTGTRLKLPWPPLPDSSKNQPPKEMKDGG